MPLLCQTLICLWASKERLEREEKWSWELFASRALIWRSCLRAGHFTGVERARQRIRAHHQSNFSVSLCQSRERGWPRDWKQTSETLWERSLGHYWGYISPWGNSRCQADPFPNTKSHWRFKRKKKIGFELGWYLSWCPTCVTFKAKSPRLLGMSVALVFFSKYIASWLSENHASQCRVSRNVKRKELSCSCF